MITYAQNLEDVLLARVFRDQAAGFYVDVGANHPVKLSITKHFYDLGWNGINVEPGRVFDELNSARLRDTNLNVAVSNTTGKATFYEYPVGHALSSLNPELPAVEAHWLEGRIERTVDTMTLRDIFAAHSPPTIDFMNIDVEGHQKQVLEGNDWQKWRPRIVLAEATDPSQKAVFTQDSWESMLLQSGYQAVFFDGLNRFYLRDEDAELAKFFHAPANVLDSYIPIEVAELRRDLRRQSAIGNSNTAKLQHAEEQLKSIREEVLRLRAEVVKELQDKKSTYRKLEACREELRNIHRVHQRQVELFQSEATLLLSQLQDRQGELNHIKRRVGPKSLDFGLKVARLVHKIATLPKRIKKGKRAA